MNRIRPNSQLPKMREALFIGDCVNGRPRGAAPTNRLGRGDADLPLVSPRLVLEPLADRVDILLGDQLRLGIEIGRGDAAVDLQVQLVTGQKPCRNGCWPSAPSSVPVRIASSCFGPRSKP